MNGSLIVFDMDGVLVEERSSWRVVHDWLGTQNEDSYRLYEEGRIDDMEFMRRDIIRWKEAAPDISIERIEGMLGGCRRMKNFPSALGRITKTDVTLGIISGGLDILSARLAREGGFRWHHANGLVAASNGILTGEGILRVPLRDKGSVLRKVREMNGFERVAVVGDSAVDISMFREADLSIAFRPMDQRVAEAADLVVREPDLEALTGGIADWLDAKK